MVRRETTRYSEQKEEGKHLSAYQLAYISSLLKEFPENHNDIKIEYKLSSTAFSRLNKFKYLTFYELERRNKNKVMNTSIRAYVQNFIFWTCKASPILNDSSKDKENSFWKCWKGV